MVVTILQEFTCNLPQASFDFDKMCIRDRYVIDYRFADIAPCNTIARVGCPVLIVHGLEDDTVPVAEAREIYAARASDAVELLLIPGSHDDYGDAGRQMPSLLRFLKQAFKMPATG